MTVWLFTKPTPGFLPRFLVSRKEVSYEELIIQLDGEETAEGGGIESEKTKYMKKIIEKIYDYSVFLRRQDRVTGHVRVLHNSRLRMARMTVEFHLLRPYLTTPEKEQLLRGEGIQVLIYGKTGERFPVTLQHIDRRPFFDRGWTDFAGRNRLREGNDFITIWCFTERHPTTQKLRFAVTQHSF